MLWLLAAEFYGGLGGPGIFAVLVPKGGLLERASEAGYGSVPSLALGSGGAGAAVMGRLRIGGFGFGTDASGSGDKGSYRASFGGGGFLVGYDLLSFKHFSVGFDATLGGWGQSLTLASEEGPVPVDSLLEDPGREVNLQRGGFALGLQAHTTVWPLQWVAVELVGGAVAFVGGDWESPGGTVVSASGEPFYGFYFGAYAFFGGRVEK